MRIALKRPWPPARLDASHTSNHLRQQFSGQADIPGTRLTDFFCSLEKWSGSAATSLCTGRGIGHQSRGGLMVTSIILINS